MNLTPTYENFFMLDDVKRRPTVLPMSMIAHVLPSKAVKALQEVALLEPHMLVTESTMRNRALDTVIARIKLAYPQLFRREDIPLTSRYTVPSFMDRSHK